MLLLGTVQLFGTSEYASNPQWSYVQYMIDMQVCTCTYCSCTLFDSGKRDPYDMTQNEERIRICRIKLKRSMMFRQIRNLDITDEFLLQKHYFEPLFVFVLSFISLLAKMASKLKVFQQILVVCLAAVECFVTTDEFFMEIIVTEMTFKSQVIALFSFSKSRPVTHTHQRISASH